eukprot:11157355-Lingulodinium_polyedra.AAC.1
MASSTATTFLLDSCCLRLPPSMAVAEEETTSTTGLELYEEASGNPKWLRRTWLRNTGAKLLAMM